MYSVNKEAVSVQVVDDLARDPVERTCAVSDCPLSRSTWIQNSFTFPEISYFFLSNGR